MKCRGRATVAAFVVAVVVLGLGPNSQAIINGTPDGNGHPYAGGVDVRPTGFRIPASGVLVSPTVFVTAGHVGRFFTNKGLTTADVSFDPVFDYDSGTFYKGDIHVNPDYTGQPNDQADMAVIVFPDPIPGITPAELPTENYLGDLSPQQLRSENYPAVGYGISRVFGGNEGGGQQGIDRSSGGTRRVGTWSFMSLTRDWIRFDMHEQEGCVGDSGAPNFLGSSDLVVGIGIAGDANCETMGSDLRLDSERARAFLDEFVDLP
jgi:V8-like Glu-specific endopeptidase